MYTRVLSTNLGDHNIAQRRPAREKRARLRDKPHAADSTTELWCGSSRVSADEGLQRTPVRPRVVPHPTHPTQAGCRRDVARACRRRTNPTCACCRQHHCSARDARTTAAPPLWFAPRSRPASTARADASSARGPSASEHHKHTRAPSQGPRRAHKGRESVCAASRGLPHAQHHNGSPPLTPHGTHRSAQPVLKHSSMHPP